MKKKRNGADDYSKFVCDVCHNQFDRIPQIAFRRQDNSTVTICYNRQCIEKAKEDPDYKKHLRRQEEKNKENILGVKYFW